MILDLRKGTEIMIPVKGAMNEGAIGHVNGKRDENYSIFLQERDGTCSRLFGVWWIEAALRGAVPYIPIVNRMPQQVIKIDDLKINEEKVNIPEYIVILQSHELVTDNESGDNIHLWGLYLDENSKDIVQEVTWLLHPTFRDPEVKCTKFPFLIKRRGWGVFKVKVFIKLKPKVAEKLGNNSIQTSHYLQFQIIGDEACFTKVPL